MPRRVDQTEPLPRIETEADVAAALALLLEADPRLQQVVETAGAVPLRRRPGGFEGLAATITNQQISSVAGAAIWSRLKAIVDPFTPAQFLALPVEAIQAAGLSRPKIRTITGVALACRDGLALDALHDACPEEAIARLVDLKGIGRWTAEIYLLFCIGHADIFPAGDLALQSAVHRGLRLRARPDEGQLRKCAEQWAPRRGVAAFLFWEYYRASRDAAKTR